MTERMFPILKDACIVAIPWAAIAPFEKQAFENHSQTLERLAQRGGLGPNEAACIIMGKSVFREPIRSKSYWRAVLMHKVNSTLHSMEAQDDADI